MLFGLSFLKIMVIVALAVLLFGVPLITLVVAVTSRSDRRAEKGRKRQWQA